MLVYIDRVDALVFAFFFFSSRRRHTRSLRDWSSDVCSSDLERGPRRSTPQPSARRRTPGELAGEFPRRRVEGDRKSTRLNSSHVEISYAVFCLKKKKKTIKDILLKKKKKQIQTK